MAAIPNLSCMICLLWAQDVALSKRVVATQVKTSAFVNPFVGAGVAAPMHAHRRRCQPSTGFWPQAATLLVPLEGVPPKQMPLVPCPSTTAPIWLLCKYGAPQLWQLFGSQLCESVTLLHVKPADAYAAITLASSVSPSMAAWLQDVPVCCWQTSSQLDR